MSKDIQNEYDVVVIGAGPAGSSSAALLAEKGHRVLMLEKEKFPRYHVGESLMPFCWHTLNRLGIEHKMDELGFQQKLSVQFATPEGKMSKPFYFFEHYDHPSSTTWQVDREEFDQVLVDRSKELGATFRDETKVKDVIRDDNGAVVGVKALFSDGNEADILCKVVIDATGRDALVASKSKWRNRDPKLDKIAIWTYYEGGLRDPGLAAGSTTIAYIPEKGWLWYIPMSGNRISVGVVADRDYLYAESRDPAEIMDRAIADNKWVTDHLAPAKQFGEYWVTGEYSYRAEYCAADGVVLAGDAFAFLDPVFSSGVFLALTTGTLAADAVDGALKKRDYSAAQFQDYGAKTCMAIEHMRKIVYAFYDKNFSFADVIRKHPHLRPKLTDLLIGNVFEPDFTELFDAIEEFANLPEELPYGKKVSTAKAA